MINVLLGATCTFVSPGWSGLNVNILDWVTAASILERDEVEKYWLAALHWLNEGKQVSLPTPEEVRHCSDLAICRSFAASIRLDKGRTLNTVICILYGRTAPLFEQQMQSVHPLPKTAWRTGNVPVQLLDDQASQERNKSRSVTNTIKQLKPSSLEGPASLVARTTAVGGASDVAVFNRKIRKEGRAAGVTVSAEQLQPPARPNTLPARRERKRKLEAGREPAASSSKEVKEVVERKNEPGRKPQKKVQRLSGANEAVLASLGLGGMAGQAAEEIRRKR